MEIAYDSVMPFLGVDPKDTTFYRRTYSSIFIVALITIARCFRIFDDTVNPKIELFTEKKSVSSYAVAQSKHIPLIQELSPYCKQD